MPTLLARCGIVSGATNWWRQMLLASAGSPVSALNAMANAAQMMMGCAVGVLTGICQKRTIGIDMKIKQPSEPTETPKRDLPKEQATLETIINHLVQFDAATQSRIIKAVAVFLSIYINTNDY